MNSVKVKVRYGLVMVRFGVIFKVRVQKGMKMAEYQWKSMEVNARSSLHIGRS